MSVRHFYRDRLRRQWPTSRIRLPEAFRNFLVWQPTGKQLFQFSGLLFGFGLLGMGSLSQLVAAMLLFSAGFAALLLITLTCVVTRKVVQGGATWVGHRAPLGYRAGRARMLEFAHSLRSVQVGPRWKHRVPAPAVPSNSAD